MKTSDIGTIVDKFIDSNATAIMFNGNWGIGKTYAIQQLLLEDRYKKERIANRQERTNSTSAK